MLVEDMGGNSGNDSRGNIVLNNRRRLHVSPSSPSHLCCFANKKSLVVDSSQLDGRLYEAS